jgi:hypothetical protein
MRMDAHKCAGNVGSHAHYWPLSPCCMLPCSSLGQRFRRWRRTSNGWERSCLRARRLRAARPRPNNRRCTPRSRRTRRNSNAEQTSGACACVCPDPRMRARTYAGARRHARVVLVVVVVVVVVAIQSIPSFPSFLPPLLLPRLCPRPPLHVPVPSQDWRALAAVLVAVCARGGAGPRAGALRRAGGQPRAASAATRRHRARAPPRRSTPQVGTGYVHVHVYTGAHAGARRCTSLSARQPVLICHASASVGLSVGWLGRRRGDVLADRIDAFVHIYTQIRDP